MATAEAPPPWTTRPSRGPRRATDDHGRGPHADGVDPHLAVDAQLRLHHLQVPGRDGGPRPARAAQQPATGRPVPCRAWARLRSSSARSATGRPCSDLQRVEEFRLGRPVLVMALIMSTRRGRPLLQHRGPSGLQPRAAGVRIRGPDQSSKVGHTLIVGRAPRSTLRRHEHPVPCVLHADDRDFIFLRLVERLDQRAQLEFAVIGEFTLGIVMVDQQRQRGRCRQVYRSMARSPSDCRKPASDGGRYAARYSAA